MQILIPPQLMAGIEQHCQATYPQEGAGFLFGKGHGEHLHVLGLLPLENKWEAEEQYHRFILEPKDFARAELEAAKNGFDLIGVFHSHPDHPSRPSEFDRDHALPHFAYLITSVVDGKAASTQAWRLQEDRSAFEEDELIVSAHH